jgi:hypothetical protein
LDTLFVDVELVDMELVEVVDDVLDVLDVDDVLEVLDVDDVSDVLDVEEVLDVLSASGLNARPWVLVPTTSMTACGSRGAGASVRTCAVATPVATRPTSTTPAATAATRFTAACRPRPITHLRPSSNCSPASERCRRRPGRC